MKTGCKICRLLNVVLIAALAGGVFLVMVPQNIKTHADGRSAVLLTQNERNKVLGEMRGLLETVQVVVQAATMGDMEAAAAASSAVGMVAAQAESPALIAKLPFEFKTLGMSTHKAFDSLAATAQGTDDPNVVLTELGRIMDNCVTCHSGYRFGIEGTDKEG
jgi:cytochrome c556